MDVALPFCWHAMHVQMSQHPYEVSQPETASLHGNAQTLPKLLYLPLGSGQGSETSSRAESRVESLFVLA